MQQFSLCFSKVKKDCLKFIKSQETTADKFKNKERMIKLFLISRYLFIKISFIKVKLDYKYKILYFFNSMLTFIKSIMEYSIIHSV